MSIKNILKLIVFLFLISCKKEFDQNGEYKQLDIIYGAISQYSKSNQIEVYTTFTSDELNKYGKVESEKAIYFQDSITLEIIESDIDGNEINSMYLNTVEDNNFESDDFDFSLNQYYQFDSSEFKITGGNSYKLKLYNLKTEKVSYSEIKCLSSFDFIEPAYNYKAYNFVRNNEFLNHKLKIENKRDNEFISNVNMYFIIATHNTLAGGGGIKRYDTLQYKFINQQIYSYKSLPANEQYSLNSFEMFGFLNRTLGSAGDEEWRRFEKVYFIVDIYSKELKEYISADNSFNSLSQTKPTYTNILDFNTQDEQLGVFYSFNSEKIFISIDDSTKQFLDTSSVYKHLGF